MRTPEGIGILQVFFCARPAADKHGGRAIPDFYERFQTFMSDSRLL
ncbi:hypothetical protein P8610_15120 [Fictibacillus sp. UD]